MKKSRFVIVLAGMLILPYLLAACASAGAQPANSGQIQPAGGSTQSAQAGVLNSDYENALPVITQLAVGLFKLEETGFPLSAGQASELITLWKAYRSLTNSETAASSELNSLIVQIQNVLSEDQQRAIAAMKLTGEDLAQLAQDRQIVLGGPGFGNNSNLTPEQQATREALRALRSQSGGGASPGGGFGPPGGVPGGGDPGGGFGPMMETTPGAVETVIARRGSGFGGGFGGVNPALVEALISYLQTLGS